MKTNNEEKREKVWREFWEEIYPTIEKYDKKLNVEETPNTNLVDNSNKLVVPCLSSKVCSMGSDCITHSFILTKDVKQAIKDILDYGINSCEFDNFMNFIEARMGKELCE